MAKNSIFRQQKFYTNNRDIGPRNFNQGPAKF